MDYLFTILCYLALCLFAQLVMRKEYDFIKSDRLAFLIRPLVGLVCLFLFIVSGDATEWIRDRVKRVAELFQDFFVLCGVFIFMVASLIILSFLYAKEYALNFLGKHHFKTNLFFAVSVLAWLIWLIANFMFLGAFFSVVIYTVLSAIILINSKEKSAWSLYPGALLFLFLYALLDILFSSILEEDTVESMV